MVLIPGAVAPATGDLGVTSWLADSAESTPTSSSIPGVNENERRSLARLAALILQGAAGTDMPGSLQESLGVLAEHTNVEPEVLASFRAMIAGSPLKTLADLYEHTVSPVSRRRLGTFFTPIEKVDSMLADYGNKFSAPEVVVDVGAGIGVFTQRARSVWPKAQIVAVDLNPITLGLQHLAQLDQPQNNVDLCLADFSEWLNGYEAVEPTVYVGNPPYTRWQLIPREDRKALVERTGGLVGARGNLSVLFMGAILAKLRPEDGASLIVPSGWMDADYGRELRSHLRNAERRKVSLRYADSWNFDNAMVDAVVVEIGPAQTLKQQFSISNWSGRSRRVLRRSIEDTSPLTNEASLLQSLRSKAGTVHKLSDFAKISRGIATGANQFFVMRLESVEAMRIDPRFVQPLIRRLRAETAIGRPEVEISGLLIVRKDDVENDSSLRELIHEAERQKLHERFLCQRRKHWFDLSSEVRRPEVVFSALGKNAFQFYSNDQKAAYTNNLFGITWKPDVDENARREILAWLNSTEGQGRLRLGAAQEANGLRRLSPRRVEDLELPRGIAAPGCGTLAKRSSQHKSGGAEW